MFKGRINNNHKHQNQPKIQIWSGVVPGLRGSLDFSSFYLSLIFWKKFILGNKRNSKIHSRLVFNVFVPLHLDLDVPDPVFIRVRFNTTLNFGEIDTMIFDCGNFGMMEILRYRGWKKIILRNKENKKLIRV